MDVLGTTQALVRPVIMVILCGAVCYLAIQGLPEARQALFGAFSILVGALWGERAALKIPGRVEGDQ